MMPPLVPGLQLSSTGEDHPKEEWIVLVTFSVTPVPMEHSSDHPQETLTVARLYIEPTLKGESGPVGDPVVSDPMHPDGVHLSRDRTLTLLGRNRRSCPQ